MICDAKSDVLAHEKFTNIMNEMGGNVVQTGFDIEAFKQGMDQHGQYRCGGNLMWLKTHAPDSVPVIAEKTIEWKEMYYKTPTGAFRDDMSKAFVVAVIEGVLLFHFPFFDFPELFCVFRCPIFWVV